MPFDAQPHLDGDLLRLRPLRPGDFDDLYRVASDPLLWEQHPASNRHEPEVFAEFFRDAIDSGGALVAIDTADDRIIGSSRYHGFDADRSEVEIGWTFLARSHWGGEYNRAMKRLMLDHAFRFVRSVVLIIGPENHRSRRAAEKIGGVLDGTRKDDTGLESVVYRVTTPLGGE
ncbi:MAG: GNAT family N-acetyltransferase [Phycisphaerales bacterium]|nr:GNAT family N-acetyltransferase [Phycisphaerales bacterium]